MSNSEVGLERPAILLHYSEATLCRLLICMRLLRKEQLQKHNILIDKNRNKLQHVRRKESVPQL